MPPYLMIAWPLALHYRPTKWSQFQKKVQSVVQAEKFLAFPKDRAHLENLTEIL